MFKGFGMGWSIFRQSVLALWHNAGTVLRLSLIPSLLIVAALVLAFAAVYAIPSRPGAAVTPVPFLAIWSAVFLIFALVPAWIAVGWHRFMLLGERPRGWWPRLLHSWL